MMVPKFLTVQTPAPTAKPAPEWPGLYMWLVYKDDHTVKVVTSQQAADAACKRLGGDRIEQVKVF